MKQAGRGAAAADGGVRLRQGGGGALLPLPPGGQGAVQEHRTPVYIIYNIILYIYNIYYVQLPADGQGAVQEHRPPARAFEYLTLFIAFLQHFYSIFTASPAGSCMTFINEE